MVEAQTFEGTALVTMPLTGVSETVLVLHQWGESR